MPGSQKVAIITGASQGIGAGLTAAFRRTGYAVVGTSRSIRHFDEADFLTVHGDIAEAETAQRVVEQALDRFGRIDSLINNAGIVINKPFTDYTPDDLAAATAVNLAGFFHMTQRAIRQMVAQRQGHIVNITRSKTLAEEPGTGHNRWHPDIPPVIRCDHPVRSTPSRTSSVVVSGRMGGIVARWLLVPATTSLRPSTSASRRSLASGQGSRCFDHHRLPVLLHAGGVIWPTQTHDGSEPAWPRRAVERVPGTRRKSIS